MHRRVVTGLKSETGRQFKNGIRSFEAGRLNIGIHSGIMAGFPWDRGWKVITARGANSRTVICVFWDPSPCKLESHFRVSRRSLSPAVGWGFRLKGRSGIICNSLAAIQSYQITYTVIL